MASTNKTKHTGLPQWEAADKPERSDFNTAFAAVDSSLAGKLNRNGDTLENTSVKPGQFIRWFDHSNESIINRITGSGGNESLQWLDNTNIAENYYFSLKKATKDAYFGGRPLPKTNNQQNIGASTLRWKDIYATNGVINTSDEREKSNIESLEPGKALELLLSLRPTSFEYKQGTSRRTHHGLIAQEVEQAMKDCGMNSLDFAGLIKSPVYEKEDGSGQVVDYTYGLRYSEFIPMMIAVIQQQQHRIGQLEAARKE